MNVSACMIVRDGEDTLERALRSVLPYVDEIVIAVDSRTTDRTRDIARKYTKKVEDYTWTDDFAAARNQVIERASNDIVLVIDADDEIEPGKDQIFRQAVTEGDGCRFIIQTGELSVINSIRAFNRTTARYIYRVHEYPKFTADYNPKVVDVPITIHHRKGTDHDPDRNLRILEQTLSEYPRYLLYHGRECFRVGRYQDAIKSFTQYLSIDTTWKEERAEAVMSIARSFAILGNLTAAKEQFHRVLLISSDWAPAYNALGQIAEAEGDYHTAVRWYEHSLSCQPVNYVFDHGNTDHDSLGHLIVAYHKTGDKMLSKLAAKRARKIKDTDWIRQQVALTEGPA